MISSPVTRPALRYFGGKWKLAPWIISFFPHHTNYVEPCGGAASVLLQKPPSPLETYNDLDGQVVNFFSVLRNQPEELIHLLDLTPWSREEFENCAAPLSGEETDLEKARRFFVLCWQSISKPGGTWRCMYDFSSRRRSAPRDGIELAHLYQVAARFKHVQIEKLDALEVIQKYDNSNSLFYFDPPYLGEVRTHRKMYNCEVDTDFHAKAAGLLNKIRGYAVVSGYRSDLYRNLYEDAGWCRFDSPSVATNGSSRTESVWLNPRAVKALKIKRVVEVSLF